MSVGSGRMSGLRKPGRVAGGSDEFGSFGLFAFFARGAAAGPAGLARVFVLVVVVVVVVVRCRGGGDGVTTGSEAGTDVAASP